MKIIYTRGNRTETLASLATLRKILGRFLAHRVFYEISSRSKRGHEFFSAKNVFVVGRIEVTNYEHLKILLFDAHHQAHSIEILNPQTMRIYDETPGRGFAVSFIVALGVVEWFLMWVRRHGFTVFAIYRILLGVVLLVWGSRFMR